MDISEILNRKSAEPWLHDCYSDSMDMDVTRVGKTWWCSKCGQRDPKVPIAAFSTLAIVQWALIGFLEAELERELDGYTDRQMCTCGRRGVLDPHESDCPILALWMIEKKDRKTHGAPAREK